MAKKIDNQNPSSIKPEDIYDVIMSALGRSKYKSINNLCENCQLHHSIAYRALANLNKTNPQKDLKLVTLHTLQVFNQMLNIEYVVRIPKKVKLINGLKRKWVLDLDRVIDLNMLRYIQNSWFDQDGNPIVVPNGMTYSIPNKSILFPNYFYSEVFIPYDDWNNTLNRNEEPGRSTKGMGITYLLKLLSDLKMKLTIKVKVVKDSTTILPTAQCNPNPNDLFLIGRYHTDQQYDLSIYSPKIYYIRKGDDPNGVPYSTEAQLAFTPAYILVVPSKGLLAKRGKDPSLKYTIFKHNGTKFTIDKQYLKSYDYVSRSSAKEYQAYGLECIVEGINIKNKALLHRFLSKDQRPRFALLSDLIKKNILEIDIQEESQSLVAQEDKPE